MKKLKSSVATTKLEEYMKSPKWKGKIFMKDEQTCYKDGFKDCFDMVCEEVEAFRHENEKLKAENEALKENKVVLHDLRKNPNDLPDHNTEVIVKTGSVTEVAVFHQRPDGTYFWSCSFTPIENHPKSVIAWCELPKVDGKLEAVESEHPTEVYVINYLRNEQYKYKLEDFPQRLKVNFKEDGSMSVGLEASQLEIKALKTELEDFKEFDPSKVLTCVSADKAKLGTKGYFAETKASLKSKIKEGKPLELVEVLGEDSWCRFRSSEMFVHALFYPVEEV